MRWDEARSTLPNEVLTSDPESLVRHWDRISTQSDLRDGPEEDMEERIVHYLRYSGLLRPGDKVLDIGCGPGTHAVHFSRAAREVTCLDYSEGMLEVLDRKCARLGLDNVWTRLESWEDFRAMESYDLVFSSYCPAVLNPWSLAKMESLSRRGCCLVGNFGGDPDIYIEILQHLTQREVNIAGLDISFPLAILQRLGREPRLKILRGCTRPRAGDVDEAVLHSYLSSFGELLHVSIGEVRAALRRVESRREEGRERKLRTGVLTWRRPWDPNAPALGRGV